jgi:hypothetical protein
MASSKASIIFQILSVPKITIHHRTNNLWPLQLNSYHFSLNLTNVIYLLTMAADSLSGASRLD